MFTAAVSAQDYSYQNKALLEIIRDIESHTEYRFLYREALIADIRISFDADPSDLFEILEQTIQSSGLGLKVNDNRNQAIIYKTGEVSSTSEVNIHGFVVDAYTGERLPFATISWRELGQIKGVNSDATGRFSISAMLSEPSISLLVSYVGYASQQITVSLEEATNLADVTVRLIPKKYDGKEIIVQGVNFYSPSDTLLYGLMKVGSFSPLGESNAVRSLQTLPAVSMNTAINDGINIRGSSSDGFQVLLDGQTMYSQSHLFGLLDAMNPDVLRSSGFYYDITPAQFHAPLGGTLSLITRTGSLNKFSTTLGLSNTAVSSTIEGPLKKGASSFILSGRWSYMDELNWFNNSKMIEYGLDVDRELEILVPPRFDNRFIRSISLDEIDVQSTNASFYDLHGKVYSEFENGNQFIISGYFGKDEAAQSYFRDEQNIITTNQTTNNWNNATISAQFNANLNTNLYSESSFGYTDFNSDYLKEDFAFPVRTNANGAQTDSVNIRPLSLENRVKQVELKQGFKAQLESGTINFGVNYTDFDVQYTELGDVRESFISRRTSQLVDVYSQWDYAANETVGLNLGSRLHYFSNGGYLKFSPRIKLSIRENENLHIGFGFSRNYQFINRLSFYNINSNDFWILSNEDQPPSSVNHLSGGVYYHASNWAYVQVEAFNKQFANLRLHELNTGLISQSFRNEETPWFYENDGRSKGLEFLVKNWHKEVTLSNAYTYSISEIKNELLNNGEYFNPSWDRRHQLTSTVDIELNQGFNLLMAWTFGTGSPSRIGNSNRLPNYSRFDVSLTYKNQFKRSKIDASFSIYNTFDRANAWYDEQRIGTVTSITNVSRSAIFQTHVYDLGIQPSFNVKISY
ncbi:MAG: TonB-dependent receptor [Balneolaceae bacterium]|nr:TonB-dependent receptor [Balneolaceae bacterium]